MTEIAEGIGEGHRKLVDASATDYGTLAVKEADVTVEFLLSTTASSVNLTGPSIGQGPSLGALTLLGLSSSESIQSSKATITFHIVPIARAEASEPANDPPSGSNRPQPGDKKIIDAILKTIEGLREKITNPAAVVSNERALLAELQRIEQLAKNGDIEEASQALLAFAQRNPKIAN